MGGGEVLGPSVWREMWWRISPAQRRPLAAADSTTGAPASVSFILKRPQCLNVPLPGAGLLSQSVNSPYVPSPHQSPNPEHTAQSSWLLQRLVLPRPFQASQTFPRPFPDLCTPQGHDLGISGVILLVASYALRGFLGAQAQSPSSPHCSCSHPTRICVPIPALSCQPWGGTFNSFAHSFM